VAASRSGGKGTLLPIGRVHARAFAAAVGSTIDASPRGAGTTPIRVRVSLPPAPKGASVGRVVPALGSVVDPLGLWPRVAALGARAGDTAARTGIATLERALASRWTTDALDAVLGSALAERAVRTVVEGPLADVAIRAAIRAGLAERVAGGLADSGALDTIVDRVLSTPLAEHVADRLLAAGVVEQTAARVLAGPELDRLLERGLASPRMAELAASVLDSDGMEGLVAQALDSRLFEASVACILASDELWLAVDRIARSPAVTEAIAHQGAGFADQVAGEVAQRSRRADARLERVARRLLRRTPTDAVGEAGPR
jgi:hypothetical protein